MNSWSHPELGSFKFDSFCWARTISLPAFKIFKYRYRGRNVGSSRLELRFEADEPDDIPSQGAIKIAERIIMNQHVLATRILRSLHADLHGKGPRSGMWWHGDVASVYEDLSHESSHLRKLNLNLVDNIARLLGSPGIMIRETGYGYTYPLATINFEALFEVEHGIGILTDGSKIVGTGYEMDASPFKEFSE